VVWKVVWKKASSLFSENDSYYWLDVAYTTIDIR
jgi:hypothetical protein